MGREESVDLRAHLVRKVREDSKATLVRVAQPDRQDRKDQLVHKDRRVIRGQSGRQVYQGRKG